MKQLILLASYPKSGNTWVRLFLSSYLSGETTEALMQNMKVGMVERAVTFRTVMRLPFTHETSTRLWGEFINRLPDSPAGNLHKTHLPRTTLQGTPLFPPDAKIIHIVRNPVDIAPSLARHNGRSLDDAAGTMLDPNGELRLEFDPSTTGGIPEEGAMPLGDWASHFRSWTTHTGDRLQLRYEDILADPEKSFTEVLNFLGVHIDENRMRFALEQTDLSVLRENEAKVGFVERSSSASTPFFGGGQHAPAAANLLSDTTKTAFRERFGETLTSLGYEIA